MEPHAFATRDGATIMWQLVSRDISSTFETASYRRSGAPTLAQRLGLGYGNPWEAAALLVFGALGLATLTTTVNIFWVIGLAVLGLLTIRLLRWLPSRWWVYACLLACVLFLVFVSPGGPTLFLVTMQGAGLATVPFGLLAFGGALAFVSWAGAVPLRRVDDVYRAGAMAFLGVFFFAFIEGVVFVQQQLGTI
jgi:hypothetical protein